MDQFPPCNVAYDDVVQKQFIVKLRDSGLDRHQIEELIDRWVFSQRDRAILKRRLLDGIRFEPLSEEFSLSVRQVKKIVYTTESMLLAKLDPWKL